MPEDDDVVRTAQDLAIEELRAEIAQMRADHAEQVRELQEANRGLWAEAHRVPAQDPAPAEPEPRAWDRDRALGAFNSALGIKE